MGRKERATKSRMGKIALLTLSFLGPLDCTCAAVMMRVGKKAGRYVLRRSPNSPDDFGLTGASAAAACSRTHTRMSSLHRNASATHAEIQHVHHTHHTLHARTHTTHTHTFTYVHAHTHTHTQPELPNLRCVIVPQQRFLLRGAYP